MMTDEQFQALQQYVYQLGKGDGSLYAGAVFKGKYTDAFAVDRLIVSINGHNWKITDLGLMTYWNESYLRLKDLLFQVREYTKYAVTEAKDVEAMRNRLQGILMLIAGDIQLTEDGMIAFVDKRVLPRDYDFNREAEK